MKKKLSKWLSPSFSDVISLIGELEVELNQEIFTEKAQKQLRELYDLQPAIDIEAWLKNESLLRKGLNDIAEKYIEDEIQVQLRDLTKEIEPGKASEKQIQETQKISLMQKDAFDIFSELRHLYKENQNKEDHFIRAGRRKKQLLKE